MLHNYVFLAVHGQKESGPDPSHTPEGFEQISHIKAMVHFLNTNSDVSIRLIVVGNAKRYWQMYDEFKKDDLYKDIMVKRCETFGTEVSVNDYPDRESELIYPDGQAIPLNSTIQLGQLISVKQMWGVLKSLSKLSDGDVLILTGRQVLRALDYPSQSGSVYQVNLNKEKIKPMMVRGVPFWNNVNVVK